MVTRRGLVETKPVPVTFVLYHKLTNLPANRVLKGSPVALGSLLGSPRDVNTRDKS